MPGSGSEGLSYTALKFSHLKKPVWILRDGDGLYWVDLQSVVQALRMSWVRWRFLVRHQRRDWQVTTCLDRHLVETELLPEHLFLQWLTSIEDVTSTYPASTQDMCKLLRGSWLTRFDEAVGLIHEPKPKTKGKGAQWKVTVEMVTRAYHLRCVVGKSLANTAKDLEISESTLKKIQAGEMTKWPADVKMAWRQSFGCT